MSPTESLTTPLALLVFNRPDLTARVFARIRAAHPRTLLVVADGPRADRPGEADLCRSVRRIVEEVDWDCHVLRNYSETNMGCGARVASGLSWVFGQCDEAIILEDDCLPAAGFFGFCSEVLDRYRTDERMVHIGGTNHQDGRHVTSDSYYFSKHPHIWGWATWRRAWSAYDYEMAGWPAFSRSRAFSCRFPDRAEQVHWRRVFDRRHRDHEPDTWDHQWNYTCAAAGGLAILPAQDLVTNIGFRPDATHTRTNRPEADVPNWDPVPLRHPTEIAVLEAADRYTFDTEYGGAWLRSQITPMYRIRRLAGAARRKLTGRTREKPS